MLILYIQSPRCFKYLKAQGTSKCRSNPEIVVFNTDGITYFRLKTFTSQSPPHSLQSPQVLYTNTWDSSSSSYVLFFASCQMPKKNGKQTRNHINQKSIINMIKTSKYPRKVKAGFESAASQTQDLRLQYFLVDVRKSERTFASHGLRPLLQFLLISNQTFIAFLPTGKATTGTLLFIARSHSRSN